MAENIRITKQEYIDSLSSNYYNKQEVDGIINGSVSQDQITQITNQLQAALSQYLTAAEVNTIITDVLNQIGGKDLGYNDIIQLISNELIGELTPEQVQEMIDFAMANIPNGSYVTQEDMNNAIASIVKGGDTNQGYRTNVTDLFGYIPTIEDKQIWFDDDGTGDPQILIRLEQLNATSDLVITAPFGMGSNKDFIGDNAKIAWALTNGNATAFPITITAEVNGAQSQITIPQQVSSVEISYFVRSDFKASYYVDVNGIAHNFSLTDTPIANFAGRPGETANITINGLVVAKPSVKEIHFGDDYLGVTELPNYFINQFPALTATDFYGLQNVTTVGSYFYSDNNALLTADLTYLTKLTKWSSLYFCSGNRGCNFIDIHTWNQQFVSGTGDAMFSYNATNPQSINIGSWSTYTNIGRAYEFLTAPNNTNCKVYADTAAIGAAFKAYFTAISQWTVVVNS